MSPPIHSTRPLPWSLRRYWYLVIHFHRATTTAHAHNAQIAALPPITPFCLSPSAGGKQQELCSALLKDRQCRLVHWRCMSSFTYHLKSVRELGLCRLIRQLLSCFRTCSSTEDRTGSNQSYDVLASQQIDRHNDRKRREEAVMCVGPGTIAISCVALGRKGSTKYRDLAIKRFPRERGTTWHGSARGPKPV